MNATDLPETTSRRGLLAGLALGLPIMAYGVRGVSVDGARTHPAELARWIVGAAAVNDLVLVPAVLLVGWLVQRLVPRQLWPAVRTGLVVSGVLALVAWPFVRGYGVDPNNPSLLPRDYGAGLVTAIAVVWLAVAVRVLVHMVGRWRSGGDGPQRDDAAGAAG